MLANRSPISEDCGDGVGLVGFVAVGGSVGEREEEQYFFPMVQALVVVFENGLAFCFAAVVFGVGVGDVAGEDFLPEGEAARGACGVGVLATQSMAQNACCATGIGGGGGAGRGLGGWCPVREILVSSTSDLLVPAPGGAFGRAGAVVECDSWSRAARGTSGHFRGAQYLRLTHSEPYVRASSPISLPPVWSWCRIHCSVVLVVPLPLPLPLRQPNPSSPQS
jgi:hypothetical protein